MSNSDSTTKKDEDYQGSSKADRITNLTVSQNRLGTDKNGLALAIKKAATNPVAIPIFSKNMAQQMKYNAYNNGEMLKNDDIKEAQDSIAAIAEFSGEDMEVWQRNAPLKDEQGVEIDLGGDDSSRVLVTKEGVTTMQSGSETLFSQSSTASQLPEVAEQGDWKIIFNYLNMAEEHKFLLVAYLTYILAHPKEQEVGYPILVIKGEQGSGKSFLCKAIIRALVDPNNHGIQMFPSSPKEMAISCKNAFVLIYDNIRKLDHKWSDALCVAATGGYLPGRKMYTDDEEVNLDLHGPKILNGIHNFFTESDAVSRCVNLQLLPIPASKRKNEREIIQQLEKDKPAIFRGLLDIISGCFAVDGNETILHPQRMMGFVHWLAKFELAEGLEAGTLQKMYAENQQQAMLDTIAEDSLAYAILKLANEYTNGEMWSGTPTALLAELANRVPAKVTKYSNTWPQNAISFSKRLSVLKPSLFAQGVEVVSARGKERNIQVGMLSVNNEVQQQNESPITFEKKDNTNVTDELKVPKPTKKLRIFRRKKKLVPNQHQEQHQEDEIAFLHTIMPED